MKKETGYLIDTQVLLWWLAASSSLSNRAREIVSDASNIVFVSSASVWEIRIKETLKKVVVPANFSRGLRFSLTTRFLQNMEFLSLLSEL